ncbi:hypothetical protein CIK06_25945 [Plantactinospora sp. KBS50]|nr:hypothetical protein CIK06_25945 [Plantactinospora sp. KBS50]
MDDPTELRGLRAALHEALTAEALTAEALTAEASTGQAPTGQAPTGETPNDQAAPPGQAPPAADGLDEVPERVALVATELATNALRHGLPPTIVRLLSYRDHLVLDVVDHDRNSVPELPDASPGDCGGQGLRLARAFSQDIGWYALDGAKHIWASFPRPAHTASRAPGQGG